MKELDFDKYGGVVLCGGDGTIHEGMNGMLFRRDKRTVPVGCVPMGTGDDFCGNFGLDIGDIVKSIKYIKAGTTIKTDSLKILLDHSSEDELTDDNALDHLRYSVTNSGVCLTASVARNAVPYKPYFGSAAYSIQTVVELIKRDEVAFDIEMDIESVGDEGVKIDDGMSRVFTDANAVLLYCYNGKTGGGRI